MNVLAVGAHFDDLELGCAGTLIKHVDRGDTVTLLVVSDSAYTAPDGEVIRDADTALREGRAAAGIIGAELITLGYPTFMIPFDEDLSRTINNYTKTLKIDTVYSHWVHDVHRDHQCVARCSLMACRHAPRFLMYRSNYYDSTQEFKGNFYSDISSAMDRKLQAIRAHDSELSRVNYEWIDFFTQQNRNEGIRIGVRYAEAFEVVRYLV